MAKSAIQTFGKYQILDRIATGGMAEIYKARLEGIGGFQRTFAIKRILPNLSQNTDYIAMLVDEAKVAGLLSHANIVQILDLGQVDGVWYIAMEFVSGPDLGRVLRRAREKGLCLPVPHGVFVAIELLKGLEYAHQRQVMRGGKPVPLNIIHRDISPPNILLSYSGEVKLTDFGIARATLRAMETVSGIVKGRFDYMSPEQAEGAKDLDQRSDLFAVGVVLYQMLTGEHPFRADNELATIERVRLGQYIPVSERNPDVPFTLQTIVDRALRVSRDERYPSATAFKEALDKFFHDAGFIFTHATLSAYLSGLFPESAPRSAKASAALVQDFDQARSSTPPPVRSELDVGDPLEDTEFPTRRVDREQVDREIDGLQSGFGLKNPDMEQTAVRENPFAKQGTSPRRSIFAADEQETLIRRIPQKSLPPGSSTWDDEQETVIKPSPFMDEMWEADAPSPEDEQEPVGSTTTADVVVREVEQSITGWRVKKTTKPNYALVFGLGAVTFLLGSILGVLLAGTVSFVVVGSQDRNEKKLYVDAPERTTVLLDGDAVSTEVPLTQGQSHTLEIRVPGRAPWSRVLNPVSGETHVIVIASETPVDE